MLPTFDTIQRRQVHDRPCPANTSLSWVVSTNLLQERQALWTLFRSCPDPAARVSPQGIRFQSGGGPHLVDQPAASYDQRLILSDVAAGLVHKRGSLQQRCSCSRWVRSTATGRSLLQRSLLIVLFVVDCRVFRLSPLEATSMDPPATLSHRVRGGFVAHKHLPFKTVLVVPMFLGIIILYPHM